MYSFAVRCQLHPVCRPYKYLFRARIESATRSAAVNRLTSAPTVTVILRLSKHRWQLTFIFHSIKQNSIIDSSRNGVWLRFVLKIPQIWALKLFVFVLCNCSMRSDLIGLFCWETKQLCFWKALRVCEYTDFANSFFIVFVIVRRRFLYKICISKT